MEHFNPNSLFAAKPALPSLGAATRILNASEIPNKQVLDTSAWNGLHDDPERDRMVEIALERVTILPTCIAITEFAAEENPERRRSLFQLAKTLACDHRPLATPNQLMMMACRGYAHREPSLSLTGGEDASGAWIALNRPDVVDAEMRKIALEFNAEREAVFRTWNEGLRPLLQTHFKAGVSRPRSFRALLPHYSSDEFLYEVIGPIYEKAVGAPLPRAELRPLLHSLPHWTMFLMSYAYAIYHRAIKVEGYGYKKNPGHLDLWSAVYLPSCNVFVTRDKPQRRALRILNRANPRPALILSYEEWRQGLLCADRSG